MTLVLTLLLGPHEAAAQTDPDEPRRLGFVEETGVTLLLLDVEAVDEKGRPLTGLTLSDFSVSLGLREWKIYSVDDLCPCGGGPPMRDPGGVRAGLPDAPAPSSGDASAAGTAPPGGARGPTGESSRGESADREGGSVAAPAGAAGSDSGSVPATAGASPPGREAGQENGPPSRRPAGPSAGSGDGGVLIDPASASSTAALPPRGEPVTFVIYLDFAQLRMDGRGRAVKNAGRWIRETFQPGERAMIVAYASATGIRRLYAPTADKAALLKSLDEAYADHALIDPFPEQLPTRLEECVEDPPLCPIYAQQEYFHGRSSMRALGRLLAAVEEIPGRKAVLYFHENGMMSPGAVYRTDTPHHLALVKDLGAAANQAHASLYTVNVGGPGDQALTLGLNLADFTGGRHNHGAVDIAGFLDETERSCRCLYRLGLVPPERPDGRTHAAVVRAAGHVLPHRYEIRFLSDADRWMRRARVVLENPGDATEIPIASAIVPVRARGRRWDVSLRIAMDTSSLTLLPGSGGLGGEWETGALFNREDGEEVRELLGVYRVRRGGAPGGTVVHEHEMDDLPPGTYRVRAFVRDRTAGLFGGTGAVVTLPHPRRGGITGPVWMYGAREQVLAPLPLVTRHGTPDAGVISRRTGLVPAGDDPVAGGQILEAHTWFCPGEDLGGSPGLRFVTGGSQPLLRFDDPRPEPAGDCFLLVDRLDSTSLPPGSYVYRLTAAGAPGASLVAAPFRVEPTAR